MLSVGVVIFILLFRFVAHTASTVEQVFPKNANYSCHSPNIKLKCTFSEDPVTAFWTVLVGGRVPEQVTSSTPGHIVDASKVKNGTLYLKVNNTVYSAKNSYRCAALYPNERTEVSEPFPIPMVEGW